MDPLIGASAHRHGIADDDIRHALDNAIHIWELDDGIDMNIGPAHDGTLLEIGLAVDDAGQLIVVHAMKARPKYLRRKKR